MVDSPYRAQADNIVISVCLMALLGLGTFSRNIDWQDSLKLWQSAMELAPKHPRPRLNVAHELLQRGDYEGARLHYERVLRDIQIDRTPAYQSLVRNAVLTNIVLVDALEGRNVERAEKYLNLVLLEMPNDPHLLVNRGLIRESLGKCEEARQDFETAKQEFVGFGEC